MNNKLETNSNTRYRFEFDPKWFSTTVEADGSGYWGCSSGSYNINIDFIEISQFDENGWYSIIGVKHNCKKGLPYTDKGFERGIKKFLSEYFNTDISCGGSEQGMQYEDVWIGDIFCLDFNIFLNDKHINVTKSIDK